MNKDYTYTFDKNRESLHDLLTAYKQFNTYFWIMVNREKKTLMFIMASNPRHFRLIPEEETAGFRPMKRVELSVNKMYTAYISPSHLLAAYGPTLGINFPQKTITVQNKLKTPKHNYYLIKAPIRYLPDIIQAVKGILDLEPQIKYEYVEKYLLEH
ncbi:MAG TPA: hypothetical protein P5123_03375 [Spirochaetota bacterium]|nr:hypothetical protein [Spirochaetota bacterium]